MAGASEPQVRYMTLLSIGRHFLIIGAIGVVLTSQPAFAVLGQTPETLCPRSTAGSNARNTSYEEFKARFGHRFKSEQETQFAWRVYQAVHNTSATVVLGRLNDVRPYLGKPGYCVLSDLRPYSIAINEVFLFGGIDRRARFLLVSESPHEIMNAGVDLNQAEDDREKYWRVIYNHELEVIRRTGQYDIPPDFKPPHLLASSGSANARWNGTYSDGPHIYTISGSGSTVSGTGRWIYPGEDFAKHGGTVNLGSCAVNGNTAHCPRVSGEYHDPDKRIATVAECTLTLSGDTLMTSCTLTRADASWHVPPYASAVHVGATFTDTNKRVGSP